MLRPRDIAAIVMSCGLAASAQAQVLESFESGNEAPWIEVGTGGDNLTLDAASAHASNFGASFAAAVSNFRYRLDLPTAPGNKYTAFVRSRGATGGRFYLGVGASAGGAYSAVFGPNLNSIILQNNTGWGFVDVASAPVTIAPNTWYVLQLDWALNGTMTVSLWDELLTTQLAATAPAGTGFTTAGGMSMRGFSNSTSQDADDLGRVEPVGPSGACCITATGSCAGPVSSAACTAAGGVYQGDNSVCGSVVCPQPTTCYANCDNSTNVPCLNFNDFVCFNNVYAAGSSYANCDASTNVPILNVNDFVCFNNRYSAGCVSPCAPH